MMDEYSTYANDDGGELMVTWGSDLVAFQIDGRDVWLPEEVVGHLAASLMQWIFQPETRPLFDEEEMSGEEFEEVDDSAHTMDLEPTGEDGEGE